MSAQIKRPAAAKKASRGKNVTRDVETPVSDPAPTPVVAPEPTPVPVAAPTPVPAPVPVAAPVPVEPATQTTSASESTSHESDGIRPARVRHLMDGGLLNEAINSAIGESKAVCKRVKQLEKELASGKVTETVQTIENSVKKNVKNVRDMTDAERASRTQELAGLADKYKSARAIVDAHKPYRTRFSLTTAAAVTGYADYVLGRLFTFAGANLATSGAKTLSREHFLQDSLRQQDFFPLISDLEVVRSALSDQHSKDMSAKHARELEQAVKSAVKAAERKIYAEHKLRKKKAAPEPAAPAVDAAAPAVDAAAQVAQPAQADATEAARGEFRTYIAAAWKCHPAAQNAGATGKSARYKFGGDAKQFLCDVVEQLIANITYLMDLQAQFNDTKTINEKSVMHVIKTKLVNVGALKREETLTMTDGLVVDPAALKAARATKTPVDINALPKIPGKVVTRVVLYKSSLLDDLQKATSAAIAKTNADQKN